MEISISFSEGMTRYQGAKRKIAVLVLNGQRRELTLGDTSRCAVSVESAERTIRNLAGDPELEVNGQAAQFHAHCRKVLGMQEKA